MEADAAAGVAGKPAVTCTWTTRRLDRRATTRTGAAAGDSSAVRGCHEPERQETTAAVSRKPPSIGMRMAPAFTKLLSS